MPKTFLPVLSLAALLITPAFAATPAPATRPAIRAIPATRPAFIPEGYNDYQQMKDLLGINAVRPGADSKSQFSEETANIHTASIPNVLKLNDGTPVTSPDQWPKRKAELRELFAREVYGRIPGNVPKVTWEVTATTTGTAGTIPTLTKTLVGHVDNSAFPQITVNIQASFTVPANATGPVPLLLSFGTGLPAPRGRAATAPSSHPADPHWNTQAIARGWGYGYIFPNSIQQDAGGNAVRQGIIGLTNQGQPRKPDDWGALRAWGWGVSQLVDYFEATPGARVDPKKIGIEGVSRFGKAALVTQAFDDRIAVAFVASSGEGGAKLHRHLMGEALENLAASLYYWMAPNFMKYAASDAASGPKTVADLPVDSHELLALCAPRPCFISHGIPPGEPVWIDAHGAFQAAILAGPVYKLLGAKDLGTPGNHLTDPMPPVGTLIGGELAWRQHEGGHTSIPNFPAFFEWVNRYIKAPPLPITETGK